MDARVAQAKGWLPGMNTALEHVAAQLRIPRAGQDLCTDWDAAMSIPPAHALPFLEPGFIAQVAPEVTLTDEMIRELVSFAARITNDEAVVAFFWYCRYRMLNEQTLVHSLEEQLPP